MDRLLPLHDALLGHGERDRAATVSPAQFLQDHERRGYALFQLCHPPADGAAALGGTPGDDGGRHRLYRHGWWIDAKAGLLMAENEGTVTMLWYKAWRESRVRFLTSALVLIGICAAVVLLQQSFRAQLLTREAPLNTYAGYIYLRVYGGFARGTFLLL